MFPYALLLTCFFIFIANTAHSLLSPVPFIRDIECTPGVQPSEQMEDLKIFQAASLVDVEGEPSAIIHGCVNAISGTFCDVPVDLVAYHGVDPYPISRTWCGTTDSVSDLHGGWHFNMGGFATYGKCKRKGDKEKVYVMGATQDQGGIVFYSLSQSKDRETCPFSVDKLSLEKGVTNTSQGYSSGQSNIRNRKFSLTDKKRPVLKLGTGERRIYEPNGSSGDEYLRTFDSLPSGNSISYSYEKIGNEKRLSSVVLHDSQSKPWGAISILLKDAKKEEKFSINIGKNRRVIYNLKGYPDFKGFWLISSVVSTDNPKVSYEHRFTKRRMNELQDLHEGLLSKKSYPDGRYLAIEYYEYNHNTLFTHHDNWIGDVYDPHINRVQKLCAPAASGNGQVPIYYFFYDLFIELDKHDKNKREVKHGMTYVYDAHRRKTAYEFNADQRLTGIRKFLDNGSTYTNETFCWGANETKDSTYLLSRQLKGPDSKTIFARTYTYDNNGNIIEDAFYGNLTGQSSVEPRLENNVEKNGAECYKKRFVYSTDGFNVPLEEDDGVTKTIYKYAPKSNKLIAKFHGNSVQWFNRWFYKYNEDGAVIEEVCDDGRTENYEDLLGVTQRKITISDQRKTYPIAYPDNIEEYFLDLATGEMVLNKRVVNTYNDTARITQQDHYGSDGALAFSLFWEYDKHGNITQEIDAIGRVINRQYDANNNCIYEKGPRLDCHKEFFYDAMNRLVREDQVHNDGICRSTHHKYDIASNKTSTIDPNGSETLYEYDELKRLTKITMPPALNEKGVAVSQITKKQYSPMGCITAIIDANGKTTSRSNTIRGEPALITYPDGSSEKIVYNLNGTVKEKTEKNGAVTKFTYDPLGRITQS